jgi:hypothetical protein
LGVGEGNPAVDLAFGLAGGLGAGLGAGLGVGLDVGLVVGLVVGLAAGLMGVLMGGTEYRPLADASRVIHDDAVFGLVVGPLLGLVSATASVRFLCASALLSRRGLSHAGPYRSSVGRISAGLLRITGGAYQFRHDTYREWLTQHPVLPRPPQKP